jgi:hypothetical protein
MRMWWSERRAGRWGKWELILLSLDLVIMTSICAAVWKFRPFTLIHPMPRFDPSECDLIRSETTRYDYTWKLFAISRRRRSRYRLLPSLCSFRPGRLHHDTHRSTLAIVEIKQQTSMGGRRVGRLGRRSRCRPRCPSRC